MRPRIAARVPGCADPVIDLAVVDTCIDFSQKTLICKATAPSFVTIPGQREYTLPVDTDQQTAKVMRVWADNTELQPLEQDTISSPFAFTTTVPGVNTPTGKPRFFTQTAEGVIALYPIPDATVYTINMRVAYQPVLSATTVSPILFDSWTDGIVHGALARLFMHPGEYLNPGLARFHADGYNTELNRAMLESRRGAIRAQARVTPVRI